MKGPWEWEEYQRPLGMLEDPTECWKVEGRGRDN